MPCEALASVCYAYAVLRDLGVVALGSVAGGVARYGLAGAVYRWLGTGFPYGTLAVNVLGCLVVGTLDGLGQERARLGPHARLLLVTGFCGAFTTFSALIFETDHLLRAGQLWRAAGNIGLSLSLGLAAFRAGWQLSRHL